MNSIKYIFIIFSLISCMTSCSQSEDKKSNNNVISEEVLQYETYHCDQGFVLNTARSASEIQVEVKMNDKVLDTLFFVKKDREWRSNELILRVNNKSISITLKNNEIYTNCEVPDSTSAPKAADSPEVKKIGNFIITELLDGDKSKVHSSQREFGYDTVDIDRDGILEYFILPMSKNFCNEFGCQAYILSNNMKLISSIRAGAPPICFSKKMTNGYRNIELYSDGAIRVLKADKNGKYPEESHTLEAHESISRECETMFGGAFPKVRYGY